jgi:hypothetical protein
MGRRIFGLSAVLLTTAALGGCTHSMQVKNLHAYSKSASAPKSLKLALDTTSGKADESELAAFVQESLQKHSAVERVVVGPGPQDFHPDLVVSVAPHTSYEGSGWNYIVSFPGFLLFTHAWNGFVYKANVVTDVSVRTPGGAPPLTRTLQAQYDLRHCDFGRGAWTSSGWYMPGWGATNLVVGAFMIPYDDDATPDFLKEVRDAYGQYVANSIVELAAQQLEATDGSRRNAVKPTCATFAPGTHRFEAGCE